MPHTIRLKRNALEKAMGLCGIASDYALAKAMDVSRSTIARVRAGELRPGPTFIASALAALTPLEFGDLFEIVPSTVTNSAS